jgi:hypothetical protein
MVQNRLDRRLQGRIDPSDVLQEAYVEVSKALADYLRNPRSRSSFGYGLLPAGSFRPCIGITSARK